jgi:hypothetical protein
MVGARLGIAARRDDVNPPGCSAARRSAVIAVAEMPTTASRSAPAASSTATKSR